MGGGGGADCDPEAGGPSSACFKRLLFLSSGAGDVAVDMIILLLLRESNVY